MEPEQAPDALLYRDLLDFWKKCREKMGRDQRYPSGLTPRKVATFLDKCRKFFPDGFTEKDMQRLKETLTEKQLLECFGNTPPLLVLHKLDLLLTKASKE